MLLVTSFEALLLLFNSEIRSGQGTPMHQFKTICLCDTISLHDSLWPVLFVTPVALEQELRCKLRAATISHESWEAHVRS